MSRKLHSKNQNFKINKDFYHLQLTLKVMMSYHYINNNFYKTNYIDNSLNQLI